MTLAYSQLYELSATKGACIEGTKYSSVFIAMSRFQYYSPDCLYFSDSLNVTLMGVNITDSIYSKMKLLNNFLEGGSALTLINCPYIRVFGCVVMNNANITADGGAIYIYMDDHNPIMSDVTGSFFVNNVATKRGGAIYIYNQNISLIKNTFMMNKAESGGAIYFDSYG
jgi:Chlamydia polymorphic membrane protein (Chlamydia_PMP) repeat